MPPPPYRADQVGSLIRPKYLLDANAASKQWLESDKDHREEADDVEIKRKAKAAEQMAISEVVSEQVRRGIVPITSGEFERPIFYGGFFEAIDGLEVNFFELEKFRTDFPTNVGNLFNVQGRSSRQQDGQFITSMLAKISFVEKRR
jgi:methionine synthase II (cobalamin-independent)